MQSNIAANREELLLTRGLNQKILSIPEVEAIKEEQAEIWRDIIVSSCMSLAYDYHYQIVSKFLTKLKLYPLLLFANLYIVK